MEEETKTIQKKQAKPKPSYSPDWLAKVRLDQSATRLFESSSPYPAAVKYVSTTSSGTCPGAATCNGKPVCPPGCGSGVGIYVCVKMQVVDQTGAPIEAIMHMTENNTVPSGTNGLGLTIGNGPDWDTFSDGTYADGFSFCTTACPGSGTTIMNQTHTVRYNGTVYNIPAITIVYACTTITIDGHVT